MRNVSRTLKALAIAGAAALFAGSAARADSISFGGYSGPITIKLSNFDTGTIYSGADGTYTNDGRDLGSGPTSPISSLTADQSNLGSVLPGEDAWGILYVTGIYKGTNPAPTPANTLWVPTTTQEITAIFWGQTDTFVKIGSGGASEEIHSNGLQAAFFVDNTPNFDQTGGPGARTNSGNQPSYPTVTDGTLLWTFNSTTGFSPAAPGQYTPDPTSEFFTDVGIAGGAVTGVVGSGGFNALVGSNDLGTGNQNNLLDASTTVTVKFTGAAAQPSDSPAGGPFWEVASQDPVIARAVPVPTPSALAGGLLLGAMISLNRIRRRRSA
jgi:hypothetical protein